MASINSIKREIKSDIQEIKNILENNTVTENELTELHIKIDGKYQSKISNWGTSLYCWIDNCGFSYNYLGKESLEHNLKTMQSKLEGYLQNFSLDLVKSPSKTIHYNNTVNSINTNTNTNDIKIEIDFEQIKETIGNLESLTDEQTKEALKYLKELEEIYKSSDPRKKKWEKSKKILIWLADKSVDVAIAYFPVLYQLLQNIK